MDKISGGIDENTSVKKVTEKVNSAKKHIDDRIKIHNKTKNFINCL